MEIGEFVVSMISVVLVGTNNLFLQGLRSLLDASQFSVAAEARDVVALQARLEGGLAPDLVVAASAPASRISGSWCWRTSFASPRWRVC